jgi:hypothetical protein
MIITFATAVAAVAAAKHVSRQGVQRVQGLECRRFDRGRQLLGLGGCRLATVKLLTCSEECLHLVLVEIGQTGVDAFEAALGRGPRVTALACGTTLGLDAMDQQHRCLHVRRHSGHRGPPNDSKHVGRPRRRLERGRAPVESRQPRRDEVRPHALVAQQRASAHAGRRHMELENSRNHIVWQASQRRHLW